MTNGLGDRGVLLLSAPFVVIFRDLVFRCWIGGGEFAKIELTFFRRRGQASQMSVWRDLLFFLVLSGLALADASAQSEFKKTPEGWLQGKPWEIASDPVALNSFELLVMPDLQKVQILFRANPKTWDEAPDIHCYADETNFWLGGRMRFRRGEREETVSAMLDLKCLRILTAAKTSLSIRIGQRFNIMLTPTQRAQLKAAMVLAEGNAPAAAKKP